MSLYCPQCKTFSGIRESDKYCWQCGSLLETQPACVCGQSLVILDKFCPACGKQQSQKKQP